MRVARASKYFLTKRVPMYFGSSFSFSRPSGCVTPISARMRISEKFEMLSADFPRHMKCVKKGMFFLFLDEEAYFLSKKFSFKLTPLDKEHIKIGFPMGALEKWKTSFAANGWALAILSHDQVAQYPGAYPLSCDPIETESYFRTRERIPKLGSVGVEEADTKRFLLKERMEELFLIVQSFLMKVPRKERYFLREKIERSCIEILAKIYAYMYDLSDRKRLAEEIFTEMLVLREFLRLTRTAGYLRKDSLYLDVSERCIEILKITKALKGNGL